VVEGARLESVYTGNCIKGSNPLVSAHLTDNEQLINYAPSFTPNKSFVHLLE
jgi:hypothetical protein